MILIQGIGILEEILVCRIRYMIQFLRDDVSVREW